MFLRDLPLNWVFELALLLCLFLYLVVRVLFRIFLSSLLLAEVSSCSRSLCTVCSGLFSFSRFSSKQSLHWCSLFTDRHNMDSVFSHKTHFGFIFKPGTGIIKTLFQILGKQKIGQLCKLTQRLYSNEWALKLTVRTLNFSLYIVRRKKVAKEKQFPKINS